MVRRGASGLDSRHAVFPVRALWRLPVCTRTRLAQVGPPSGHHPYRAACDGRPACPGGHPRSRIAPAGRPIAGTADSLDPHPVRGASLLLPREHRAPPSALVCARRRRRIGLSTFCAVQSWLAARAPVISLPVRAVVRTARDRSRLDLGILGVRGGLRGRGLDPGARCRGPAGCRCACASPHRSDTHRTGQTFQTMARHRRLGAAACACLDAVHRDHRPGATTSRPSPVCGF